MKLTNNHTFLRFMGLSHVLLTFHLRAKSKSHQNLPTRLTPAVTVYYGILISRLFFTLASINSVPFYNGVSIGYSIKKILENNQTIKHICFHRAPQLLPLMAADTTPNLGKAFGEKVCMCQRVVPGWKKLTSVIRQTGVSPQNEYQI